MSILDTTTIVNRVRELSNNGPVTFKGHDGEEKQYDASLVAATLVGAAIGCHCPIPPRSIPTPNSYFASTFGKEVQEVISKINESVTIRTQVAYDAACVIWNDRYNMVHKPCDVESLLNRLTECCGDSFGKSVPSLLVAGLDEQQKETLDKLVRSVNLSCSNCDANGKLFKL